MLDDQEAMFDDKEAMFDDQEAMCVPMHFKVTATARFGCDNNHQFHTIAKHFTCNRLLKQTGT